MPKEPRDLLAHSLHLPCARTTRTSHCGAIAWTADKEGRAKSYCVRVAAALTSNDGEVGAQLGAGRAWHHSALAMGRGAVRPSAASSSESWPVSSLLTAPMCLTLGAGAPRHLGASGACCRRVSQAAPPHQAALALTRNRRQVGTTARAMRSRRRRENAADRIPLFPLENALFSPGDYSSGVDYPVRSTGLPVGRMPELRRRRSSVDFAWFVPNRHRRNLPTPVAATAGVAAVLVAGRIGTYWAGRACAAIKLRTRRRKRVRRRAQQIRAVKRPTTTAGSCKPWPSCDVAAEHKLGCPALLPSGSQVTSTAVSAVRVGQPRAIGEIGDAASVAAFERNAVIGLRNRALALSRKAR